MNASVELPEGDQRIFLIDVRGRHDQRVDGRLFCGFCRGYYDLSWYPSNPQQSLERKVVLQHLGGCPARGDINTINVAIFDGPGGPTETRRITMSAQASKTAREQKVAAQ